MQYIKSQVSTIAMGSVASMGAVILAAGEKGKRFSLPNSRIMIHQPSSGMRGPITDMEIYFKEGLKSKELLKQQLAQYTGKSIQELHDAMERDNYMSATEAKEFGLIDEVLTKKS
jgi:ATP-dependent Clp protease protease subunit